MKEIEAYELGREKTIKRVSQRIGGICKRIMESSDKGDNVCPYAIVAVLRSYVDILEGDNK